jgi:hypothetical protein
MTEVEDRRPVEDILWSDEDYHEAFLRVSLIGGASTVAAVTEVLNTIAAGTRTRNHLTQRGHN